MGLAGSPRATTSDSCSVITECKLVSIDLITRKIISSASEDRNSSASQQTHDRLLKIRIPGHEKRGLHSDASS